MFIQAFVRVVNFLLDRPYYAFTLGACGRGFRLGYGSFINFQKNVFIGDSFFSGPNLYISTNSETKIIIGDDVMIGPGVRILSGNHNISLSDTPMSKLPKIYDKDRGIVIEDNVWIGAGCILLDGAHLKKGTVLAAGAVISCQTEVNSIYGGVPARLIKFRS